MEEERTIAIAYLCNVSSSFLEEEFDVCRTIVQHLITYTRATTWKDPIVDFYLSNGRSLKNSAHLYLSHNNVKLPRSDLATDSESSYNLVFRTIYIPILQEVLERTALARYAEPKKPLEHLLNDTFADEIPPPLEISKVFLDKALVKEYGKKEFDLKNPKEYAIEKSETLIRSGIFFMNLTRSVVIYKALDGLTSKQRAVLTMRYNEFPLNYSEIGRATGSSRANIHEIAKAGKAKLRANENLRNSFINPLLQYLRET